VAGVGAGGGGGFCCLVWLRVMRTGGSTSIATAGGWESAGDISDGGFSFVTFSAGCSVLVSVVLVASIFIFALLSLLLLAMPLLSVVFLLLAVLLVSLLSLSSSSSAISVVGTLGLGSTKGRMSITIGKLIESRTFFLVNVCMSYTKRSSWTLKTRGSLRMEMYLPPSCSELHLLQKYLQRVNYR
jgi:hypothetical protein